jgi:hypothetical protein
MRHEKIKPNKKSPMSAVERQRKHRARLKKYLANLTEEQKFRRELLHFVRMYWFFHRDLPADLLYDSLTKCGLALMLDSYAVNHIQEQPFICADFLACTQAEGWTKMAPFDGRTPYTLYRDKNLTWFDPFE